MMDIYQVIFIRFESILRFVAQSRHYGGLLIG